MLSLITGFADGQRLPREGAWIIILSTKGANVKKANSLMYRPRSDWISKAKIKFYSSRPVALDRPI